jgi:phosphatidylserine/phosphatidylglycerophosphate/cardiolipin synthase-like enzyme
VARVKYRPYDPLLHHPDIQLLWDVDEYFPDAIQTLGDLSAPRIFLTAWLLVPDVYVSPTLTFQALVARELKKNDARMYILWNTNYKGTPFVGLRDQAKRFHQAVTTQAGLEPTRLKIILSTNTEFDPPTLSLDWQTKALWIAQYIKMKMENPDRSIPTSEREYLHELWVKLFPLDATTHKNLAAFTLGAHHQKTLTTIGTTGVGSLQLQAYCGGIDFSPGPCGQNGNVYNGGHWWHDLVMRVRGANARPILDNFVQRWNADLESVVDGNTLSFGEVTASDELDVDALTSAVPMAATPGVACLRTMPEGTEWLPAWSRTTEIRSAYKSWIPRASTHIIIVNQYFRDLEIAALLEERILSDPSFRVTIVIPTYTEEMGKDVELAQIREDYVNAGTATLRASVFERAQARCFTIDPFNKTTLYAQTKALANLIVSPSVRVWMPRPLVGRKYHGIPYIHAKLIVVDDQMLMVGSANLNGRSLTGLADSEINLMLTNAPEIQRLLGIHRLQQEPESETAAAYANSWYAKHNLVRYTPSHWTVDMEYARFPHGKAEILTYAETVKQDARLKELKLTFSRADLESRLAAAPRDLETTDMAEWLLEALYHLL